MAGTDNHGREATPTPSDDDTSAIAHLPVTASDPDYRIQLPPLRSPHVAQLVLLGGTLSQLALALLITIYLARVLTAADFVADALGVFGGVVFHFDLEKEIGTAHRLKSLQPLY